MLCRYFQQGYCKFGDNCRFVHDGYDQDDAYYYDNSRYAQSYHGNRRSGGDFNQQRQYQPVSYGSGGRHGPYGAFGHRDGPNSNRFGASDNQTNQKEEITVEDHLAAVQVDFKEWGSSGMWQLSCYGLSKSLKCVPGFEEFSFEEIRHAHLMALQSGQVDQYMNWLRNVHRVNADLRQQFLHPVGDQKNALIGLVKMLCDVEDAKKERRADGFSKSPFGPAGGSAFHNPEQGKVLVFGALNQGLVQEQPAQQMSFQPQQHNIFQQQPPQNIQQTSNFTSSQQPVQDISAFASHRHFGQQSSNVVAQIVEENIYSGMDVLSSDDVEQFRSNDFTRIPLHPPPKKFT